MSCRPDFALRAYEPLLRGIERVAAQDLPRLAERFLLAGDARDALAARDSLTPLLGPAPIDL